MPASDDVLEIELSREYLKSEIRDAIKRGTIRHNVLVRRFSNPEDARLSKEYVSQVVLEVQEEMIAEYGHHDPRMDILAFLTQGDIVAETLNDLLDLPLQPRDVVMVTNALSMHWKDRISFLKFIGAFNKLSEEARGRGNMLTGRGEIGIESSDKFSKFAQEADEYDAQDADFTEEGS